MKKLGFVAVMLMVGASAAFAGSLGVPWYVDNAPTNVALNPTGGATLTLIYLKNNTANKMVCQIAYYAADGTSLGPAVGSDTFEIEANAAIAFRPVADDTNLASGGQEDPNAGGKVPNRPRTVNTSKNGSISIRHPGSPGALSGEVTAYTSDAAGRNTFSYALVF